MNLAKEVAALNRLSTNELKQRYAETFGEATRTGNRSWLMKRVAWRMQAQAEGGLTERAQRRAAELARDADIRMTPPKDVDMPLPKAPPMGLDPRLPPPGSIITRDYKGT